VKFFPALLKNLSVVRLGKEVQLIDSAEQLDIAWFGVFFS
jgi:hypothetical protein